jgi:hypothetical protein
MTRLALMAACLVVAGCGGGASGTVAPPASCGDAGTTFEGVWVASDYASSAVGAFAASGAISSTTGVDLGADPAIATSGGRAFYIARDQDLVFPIDPACGTLASRFSVHEASHDGPSDPQDVAVASDGSLWVPLYDVPTLLVLDPTGATVLDRIDLSPYDGDGNPQASAVAIVGTPSGEKAFVALQRLADADVLQSEQPSWMLRIDVKTRTVETHVELAGRNPFAMRVEGTALWLSEPGNFDAGTEPLAGVERFDTSTSTTALLAHEADLGGSVAEVAVSGNCGVAIVAGPTAVNATSLVTFDATTGAVITPAAESPLATGGFDLQGLDWVGSALLAGDRRRLSAGYPVHVFDAAACALHERVPDLIELPLPPVALR